jgi:hypothetical protein
MCKDIACQHYFGSCLAMFEPESTEEPGTEELEAIYRRSPVGALAVAGIATGLVFAMWLAFYVVIFLPRGFQQ